MKRLMEISMGFFCAFSLHLHFVKKHLGVLFLVCFFVQIVFTQETNCANGLDDDGDGYVDVFDNECTSYNPFVCDGYGYLSAFSPYYAADKFNMYRIDLSDSSLTHLFQLDPNLSHPNAFMFRPKDGFMYFVEYGHPHKMYRLDQSGNLQLIDSLPQIAQGVLAGALGMDGRYFLSTVDTLYAYDFYNQVLENVMPIIDMSDIAVHKNGNIYGWNEMSGKLIEIDPITQALDSLPIQNNDVWKVGGMFFDRNWQLYGYGSDASQPTAGQSSLMQFDINTGAKSNLVNDSIYKFLDACSCPYQVEFSKTTQQDTIESQLFDYTFEIESDFPQDMVFDAEFSDLLYDGLVWTGQINNVGIDLQLNAIHLADTSSAELEIQMPGLHTSSFDLQVSVPCNLQGDYLNQAILQLENQLGNISVNLFSDDPETSQQDDITFNFISVSQTQSLLSAQKAEICVTDSSLVQLYTYLNISSSPEGFWQGPSPLEGGVLGNFNPYEDQVGVYTFVDTSGTCIELHDVQVSLDYMQPPAFIIEPQPGTSASFLSVQDVQLDYDYQWFSEEGVLLSSKPFFTIDQTQDSLLVCLHKVNTEQNKQCQDSTCKALVRQENYVYVPSAFTPDDRDDLNRQFQPFIEGYPIKQYLFKVYDRWSNVVFETSQSSASWNPSSTPKNNLQGVYLWELTIDFEKGRDYQQTGKVLLIK